VACYASGKRQKILEKLSITAQKHGAIVIGRARKLPIGWRRAEAEVPGFNGLND
jgi:hypothetical protein